MPITETTEVAGVPIWTLGERLAKAREHAGISIDEMARLLGVSPKTIRNYENEAVRITKATAIAYSVETLVPLDWIEGDPISRSRCFPLDDGITQLELFANGHLAGCAA